MRMDSSGITSVPGIRVGHYTDRRNATGCTVVLCEDGAVGGVDVRGSAPGTRETDLLSPTAMVDRVHAVLLSGGSAFGLAAATGVVEYLEEKGVGIEFGSATIPIVPAAILFDLGLVTHKVRPDARAGRLACESASSGPFDKLRIAEGSVGAGTGATVGKLLGRDRCVKGGIGTASVDLGDGLIVGAIVAVNAVGGVVDPETGQIVAGPLADDGVTIHNARAERAMLDSMKLITDPEYRESRTRPGENTTIGVIATNATLTKAQANKLASVGHDGLAMAVRPAHLMSDGDTLFALSTRQQLKDFAELSRGAAHDDGSVNMNRLCAAAAVCVSRAIVRAVRKATGVGGVKAVSELGLGTKKMTTGEAAVILRQMYDRGRRLGEVSSYLHLFGIKYADELSNLSLPEVVKRADIPSSYPTEIYKGMKLSKYVEIKQGVEL